MNDYAKNCFTHSDDEGFAFKVDLTGNVFSTCGDGYWSTVETDVKVTEMGTYISNDDEGFNGDFYVLYDENTWDDDRDGLIYTDSAFLECVQFTLANVLTKMGIDTKTAQEIAATVDYSEQGMQDYGRVSFDAFELQQHLRKFYREPVAA